MTESLEDRYARKEKELSDGLRAWWSNPENFGPGLGAASPGFNWDKAAGHMKAMGIESLIPHGGTGAHALVAGMEFMEKLKQADPKPYCSFAELAGMKMHTSDLMPPGVAYMMRLPDPDLSFRFNPIELPKEAYEPEDYSQLKFRIMQEYNVGLRGPRSLILACDIGGFDEPRVVWPEPEAPAQPLSGWQWLVIVGVLSWILCALSRAV